MTFCLSLKVLFRHGFDFIHAANPPDLFFVIGLFYRLFGKKFIFDQHDLSPELFQVPDLKGGRFFLLAYGGVMEVQDSVENCLYALHHLIYQRGCQDIALVLLGGGDQVPTLQTLAHELQLGEYATFTGWTTPKDIMRYLTVADVGLVPDLQNGSPWA